jgi:two-component system sensor histidine kinase TctE
MHSAANNPAHGDAASPASARTGYLWVFGDGRPSLHRRLLKFLLGPVLLVLVLDAMLIYLAALAYSNRVHDNDLIDTATGLAGLIATEEVQGELSAQARYLLEYDPDGRNYFRVTSSRRGMLAENAALSPEPPSMLPGQPAVLFNAQIGRRVVRAATLALQPRGNDNEIISITVAETLQDRHARAREILIIAVPMLGLLIVIILFLVWFGVSHGLRVIDPLTARLASRPPDLAPISDADVPSELLPLTRTIDALFARLHGVLAVQERFVADAAHQLRTPLAGLSLHVQRALADRRESTVADALRHIDELCKRAARTSSQLLALSRAQAPAALLPAELSFDLTERVTTAVGERIGEALSRNCDLGYEGIKTPLQIEGDAALLQDLIDNLIDNALHYAGPGSIITVAMHRDDRGIVLSIEDDGPGVDDAYLPRLGERFFRVPDQTEPGTGLGLAIVRQIAERFGAQLRFMHGRHRQGLRAEVVLPIMKGG